MDALPSVAALECRSGRVFAASIDKLCRPPAAGLLRGRRATSNRTALDQLQQIDPNITVEPEERYVDEGDIITSAGISAGIDMALHIVGRLASPQRAQQVRDGISSHQALPETAHAVRVVGAVTPAGVCPIEEPVGEQVSKSPQADPAWDDLGSPGPLMPSGVGVRGVSVLRRRGRVQKNA